MTLREGVANLDLPARICRMSRRRRRKAAARWVEQIIELTRSRPERYQWITNAVRLDAPDRPMVRIKLSPPATRKLDEALARKEADKKAKASQTRPAWQPIPWVSQIMADLDALDAATHEAIMAPTSHVFLGIRNMARGADAFAGHVRAAFMLAAAR